ncbi:MAG: methylamine dehydrogenase accessory protein MauD [Deltaproteobacteria bacterium]|jgi:methylamine dehydrogenase accessory protein MauD|nr:methylamine dehydrogenase accessory protein MauD [Deltaproteobacteria bacterium]
MTDALVISNTVLWIAVVVLGVVVTALTRQIGLLHERLAPMGALAQQRGPEVGDAASVHVLTDLSGRSVNVGGPLAGTRTLLFFLSPSCPVCDTLLPTLLRVARDEAPGLRVVLASDGEPEEHHRFRSRKGLDDQYYVLSRELGLAFAVSKLPTAILIDEEGIVRAKGIVNTREHLESLFAAHELGAGSIQQFIAQAQSADDSVVHLEARR